MGLDMYLKADILVSENIWDKTAKGAMINPSFSKILDAIEVSRDTLDGNWITIQLNLGYWRKANAIHNWFVNECGGGIDECQEIGVFQDKLVELKEICNKVLEVQHPDIAHDLLPTASGFFFGSTEYDEWYYKDLEHTIEIIDAAIAFPHTENFIYQASW